MNKEISTRKYSYHKLYNKTTDNTFAVCRQIVNRYIC